MALRGPIATNVLASMCLGQPWTPISGHQMTASVVVQDPFPFSPPYGTFNELPTGDAGTTYYRQGLTFAAPVYRSGLFFVGWSLYANDFNWDWIYFNVTIPHHIWWIESYVLDGAGVPLLGMPLVRYLSDHLDQHGSGLHIHMTQTGSDVSRFQITVAGHGTTPLGVVINDAFVKDALNAVFRGIDPPIRTITHVGVLDAELAEVSLPGYARQPITLVPDGANGLKNDNTVSWPFGDLNWNVPYRWGFFTSGSGGLPVYVGSIYAGGSPTIYRNVWETTPGTLLIGI